jgi:nucleotide-binding universal stress UspA family protein
MFLLLFIFVNLAVINLRKNRPDLERGFKVPFFPLIPIVAVFVNLFLVIFLFIYRPFGVWVCIGYMLFGIFIYYLYSRKKEFTAKAEPVIHAEHPVFHPEARPFRILVPVANEKTVERLQRFAVGMAKAYNADITVLNVIQVPPQLPPSEGRKYLSNARALLEKAIHVSVEEGVPASSLVKLTHNIPKAIIETCEERKINLMILGWEGEKAPHNRIFGTILDEIIRNTVCDITLLCRPPAEKAKIKRVLIPVGSIKNAILSLKIAEAMFMDKGIPIVLFHSTSYDDVSDIKQRYLSDIRKHADEIDPDRYQIIIRKAYRFIDAIQEETQPHDLIIMGSSEEGLIRRALIGDMPAQITKGTDVPIILTKRYTGHIKSWFQKFFGSRKTLLD